MKKQHKDSELSAEELSNLVGFFDVLIQIDQANKTTKEKPNSTEAKVIKANPKAAKDDSEKGRQ